MESVGKILHAARIAKGIFLEDAERVTSIRRRYLEAVENEQYDKTPGEVFIKGIIRTYGNFLGLNGAELVNIYKANKIGAETTDSVKSEGIREVKDVHINVTLKQHRSIGSGTEGFHLPMKQILCGAVAVAILAGGYFAVPKIMNAFQSSEVKTVAQESVQTQAAAPVIPAEKYDHVTVEMTATDKCWLEVTADGKEIFADMLLANDHKKFEAKEKLVIKYGNIGVMRILFNGKPVEIKGEHGVAVKTYSK